MVDVDIASLANLGYARSNHGAFVIDDVIYVVGGSQFHSGRRHTEVYDTHDPRLPLLNPNPPFGQNFWTMKSGYDPDDSSPGGSIGFVQMMCAGVDNAKRIWIVSEENGYTSQIYARTYLICPSPVNTTTIHITVSDINNPNGLFYDRNFDAWTPRQMVGPQLNASGAVDRQGRVYAIGGIVKAEGWIEQYRDDRDETGGTGCYPSYYFENPLDIEQVTATCQMYDPAIDAWKMIAGMTQARFGALTIVDAQDRVYALGGDASEANTNYRIGDTSNFAWLSSLALIRPLQYNVPDGHPPVVGAFVQTTGGATNSVLNSVERYDPNTNTWTNLAPMSRGVVPHSHPPILHDGLGPPHFCDASVAMDARGRLVVVSRTVANFKDPWFCERYDPATDTWTRLPDLPGAATIYNFGTYTRSTQQFTWTKVGSSGGQIFAYVLDNTVNNERRINPRIALYSLTDDVWVLEKQNSVYGGISYIPFVMDSANRFYSIGGLGDQPDNDLASQGFFTAVSSDVFTFDAPIPLCVHGTATLGSVTLVVRNTEEMSSVLMPDVSVEITEPHFDPCHPQTESEPIRIDSQVYVRNRKV